MIIAKTGLTEISVQFTESQESFKIICSSEELADRWCQILTALTKDI
ncbi:hypothetical protein A5886_000998 [Enterococcus sp. 8G7_MSG3316]|uniref:PH domain-containing protein n=1 Tax=Candidatus Enterococcus testudinis TaxID=1834191 RepID=A0A242A4P1_9ENTE|nr:hypothetical protein [Enterococcus sp. 8G7_MSG3316]OTN75922.1 hypothetical protein A5886_000998 [Enterococcus sp. 8G7_MSG3316]